MTSRESLNIWWYIERRNWKSVKRILLDLISIKRNSNRKLIIDDSLIRPFNKKIGCKLFGHKWSTIEDNIKYEFDGNFYCWKCSKWESKEQRRDSKIKSIIK